MTTEGNHSQDNLPLSLGDDSTYQEVDCAYHSVFFVFVIDHRAIFKKAFNQFFGGFHKSHTL